MRCARSRRSEVCCASGSATIFVDSYLKLKNDEWAAFNRHLSGWEMSNTLDC